MTKKTVAAENMNASNWESSNINKESIIGIENVDSIDNVMSNFSKITR